ncbi:MAG: triphosphoribosyl-dephospho-CoA synthase [Pirellulaceae bacterium]|jgi:triphosphoribosyl-dephospho-CoA synthase|nr:triphosphoribosyl-dephospho-CoA synthase [Pirellulaceae bacterium]MDP7017911.1 triphosphoribosyl-dephospho-CoA synthase [Pirellulaceae bacterium]
MTISALSPQQLVTLACLLEATAPKVGNVHRGADFEDLTFQDFASCAVVAAPHLTAAGKIGVGRAALNAVTASREIADTNVNLGIALLLAPLCAAVDLCSPEQPNLDFAVGHVLDSLDENDAEDVWQAIRLANPGGLGATDDMDVANSPPKSLLDAMSAAAHRDLVARQYATNFEIVFHEAAVALAEHRMRFSASYAIICAHVELIARHGDSLIARKCGPEVAAEACDRAQRTLDAGDPSSADYQREINELDFWMRTDGNRRNPGATADLIAAGLFVALYDQTFPPPWR